jgi:putative tricarboxylic transport membrane protein
MRDDLILSAAMLALAAGYATLAGRIPTSLLSDAVGAGGLPRLFALLLALLALLLAGRALLVREPGGLALRAHVRPFGIVALGAVYIALAPLLGYVFALALLIAAAIAHFGARAPVTIAANAVAGAVLLWLVFAKMLGIAMPAGAWARLFG